jgi:hypothetical protein
MFNELTRVGALLTLQLTPPATPGAPWTWRLPTWHWLYNEARVLLRAPGDPRRLLHIARDGGDAAGCDALDEQGSEGARLSARKRALLEFTRAHVLTGGTGAAPPPRGF